MTPQDCPCGAGKPFAACCEPVIAGRTPAPTAEAAMRARYAAYATGRVDFIEASLAPSERATFNRAVAEQWSREATWKGLTIVAVKDGGPQDGAGVVNFIARFVQDGKEYEHRELAAFRKEGGVWYFVDGQPPKPQTYVHEGPSAGRNDPCPCGSGKKFKKCHGKA